MFYRTLTWNNLSQKWRAPTRNREHSVRAITNKNPFCMLNPMSISKILMGAAGRVLFLSPPVSGICHARKMFRDSDPSKCIDRRNEELPMHLYCLKGYFANVKDSSKLDVITVRLSWHNLGQLNSQVMGIQQYPMHMHGINETYSSHKDHLKMTYIYKK